VMTVFHSKTGATLVAISLLGLTLFMGALYSYALLGRCLDTPVDLMVTVRQGESLNMVTRRLGEEKVLHRPDFVRLLGLLRGDSSRVKAGEYLFRGRVSPMEFLDVLVTGRGRLVSITIPEGLNLIEVARRLASQGLGREEEYARLSADPEFIAGLDLPFRPPFPTLEGFLYPETYHVQPGTSAAGMLTTLVREFKLRAVPLLQNKANPNRLTPYEALVMASIIEKETGAGKERPLISAVFHNRLKIKMRLRSDPTVIYGLENFDGNITRRHLLTYTPYNTYQIPALPPTPIANPGLDSIRASVAPAAVDYLFFVSKGDGTHFFSKDYATHQRAVEEYQIHPNRRKKS